MSLLAKAHKNLFLSLRDKVGCLGLSKAWDRKVLNSCEESRPQTFGASYLHKF